MSSTKHIKPNTSRGNNNEHLPPSSDGRRWMLLVLYIVTSSIFAVFIYMNSEGLEKAAMLIAWIPLLVVSYIVGIFWVWSLNRHQKNTQHIDPINDPSTSSVVNAENSLNAGDVDRLNRNYSNTINRRMRLGLIVGSILAVDMLTSFYFMGLLSAHLPFIVPFYIVIAVGMLMLLAIDSIHILLSSKNIGKMSYAVLGSLLIGFVVIYFLYFTF